MMLLLFWHLLLQIFSGRCEEYEMTTDDWLNSTDYNLYEIDYTGFEILIHSTIVDEKINNECTGTYPQIWNYYFCLPDENAESSAEANYLPFIMTILCFTWLTLHHILQYGR